MSAWFLLLFIAGAKISCMKLKIVPDLMWHKLYEWEFRIDPEVGPLGHFINEALPPSPPLVQPCVLYMQCTSAKHLYYQPER